MSKTKQNKATVDYQVGYGKPPANTQFKPGQSGNPKGRPKRQPSIQELLEKELKKKILVKVGDQVEKISKKEALVKKLLHSAIEGKPQPMRMILQVMEPAAQAAELAQADDLNKDIQVSDNELLQIMIARIKDDLTAEDGEG